MSGESIYFFQKEGSAEVKQQKSLLNDLTQGKVFNRLFTYSLPYMAAVLCNTLYNLVDLAVIGKFTDSVGVSAVSNAGNLTMLLYATGVALGAGGGIYVSQLVGAKRHKELNETIGTLTTFSLICGIVITLLGIVLARPALTLLNTPEEAMNDAVIYLRICAIGIPFTFCFGNFSDMLRGMGDSVHPLIISVFMILLNLVLDVWFVAGFRWGAAGAAIATTISHIFSLFFSWIFLYRRREQFFFDFKLKSFAMKKDKLLTTIKLSAPILLTNVSIQISMMFVNTFVNEFGVVASAVAGIGSKLTSVTQIVTGAIHSATSAVVGQNMGAGRLDRVEKTVYSGWIICLVYFVFLGTACFAAPEQVFGLFSNDPLVLSLGRRYMAVAFWAILSFCLMSPALGLINGIGYTSLNLVIGLLDSVVARIALSLLFGKVLMWGSEEVAAMMNGIRGLEGFWLGNALAGYVSVILGAVYFFSGRWKNRALLK